MAPTSVSSQGSEDSTLPLSGSGSDASDRSSGTPPVPESSSDTGPTSPDGPMWPTSTETLSYIAGLIDGEGWIGIWKNGGNYYPRVKLKMSEKAEALVSQMEQFFGGRLCSAGRKSPKHAPTLEWQLDNPSAVRQFLIAVGPFLQLKAEQANLAMRLLDRLEGLPPRPGGHPGSHQWAQVDRDFAEACRIQMHILNAKGPLRKESGEVMPQEASSISSSEASRSCVSPSAPQDDEEARTMTDTSGPSSAASSMRFDPATWSSRTSLVCSLQDGGWVIEQASLFGTTPLATFSETFPRWGSMRDGQVFAHPTPERVTSDSASSSLPTPDTMGNITRSEENLETGHAVSLPRRIDSMLHTPTTGDTAPTYDHRASPGYTRAIPVPNLAAQVDQMLPTPRPGATSDNTSQPGYYDSTETVVKRLSTGDRTKPESEGGNE